MIIPVDSTLLDACQSFAYAELQVSLVYLGHIGACQMFLGGRVLIAGFVSFTALLAIRMYSKT